MGSTRLPNKVLKEILGRPMLGHMISRLKRCNKIDNIAVATSINPADDMLAEFCAQENILCHRGSEENVLKRFTECANLFPKAKHIIRVTGDCPLIDPDLLDIYIASYLKLLPAIDHYHLGIPHYPRGLDAEIFSDNALKVANEEATSLYEKEHVTPYIYQHPEQFKSQPFLSGLDYRDQRWCVDEEADFEFVTEIFKNLYPKNNCFGWKEVLTFLNENPEILKINQHVRQKNL